MIHSETKNAAAVKQHKTGRKTAEKAPGKKPYTMEIHESLERIREGELSGMGLLELSIRAFMPEDVFKELKRRIELIQKHLNICLETTNVKVFKSSQTAALEVVNSLLKNPQKTRK
jgi:hypothetical protein